jgi:N-acetylgalactosamine-6-sulfatase
MKNQRQKIILIALFGAAILTATATKAEAPAPAAKPNVIFILTDDQGWGDAHFAGHPYVKTPSLDKFAAQSTWLRQFYVAATVCSPSRTAFMTSHYPARHHIHGHFADPGQNAARHMPNWLDAKTPTLASLLQGAGYATAHFGKWHLGHGPGAPLPTDYGFNVAKTVNSNGPQLGDESKEPYFRAKSTELIVDETIRFIREHKEGPFYVNVWTLLPHAPLKPTPEQLAVYADFAPSATNPAFGPAMQDYLGQAKNLRRQMQVYAASLTDLDTQLGRLFTALDELKLADNTIIFLSSDNGPEDYRISNAANAGVGNAGPLRARKRSMYEGGIRTFGLVRWPGHVPAGRRDETSVTGGVDFLPTICQLAGVDLPAGLRPDGEDVSDIWLGRSRPRTKPLHWEWLFNVAGGKAGGYMPPMLAVRDGDWKLFVNYDGTGAQLYNIPKDAGEANDLAAQNPDVVKSLTAKALAWAKSLPPSPARAAAGTKNINPGNKPPQHHRHSHRRSAVGCRRLCERGRGVVAGVGQVAGAGDAVLAGVCGLCVVQSEPRGNLVRPVWIAERS